MGCYREYLIALSDIRKAYFAALEGISQSDSTEKGEMKHAIKDVNGKQYVEADRDVIKGSNPKEWAKQIEDHINKQIRKGKNVVVYTANGVPLTITADTAGKAAFRNYVELQDGSKRLMTDEEYAVKLRAEAHIDELGQVSMGVGKTVLDSKGHLFSKDGFNYRTAYFKDKTGYYELTLSIGKNGKINTIYNVGKIKEAAFPTNGLKGPTRSKTETGNRASLIDKVPQKDTSGKDNIRNGSEDDAGDPVSQTVSSARISIKAEVHLYWMVAAARILCEAPAGLAGSAVKRRISSRQIMNLTAPFRIFRLKSPDPLCMV